MIPGQLAFAGTAGPAARATDPDTSLEAGRKAWQDRGRLQQRVVLALSDGPMTDSEIVERIERVTQRRVHPGSVSKRRGELRDEGVVVDTGVRRMSPFGREQIVWQLVEGET